MSLFTKATRSQRRARIALMGPSGSGKTYTALTLAKGLAAGGTIAVIDTEASSASLYAGTVADFDACAFDSYEPKRLVAALAEAEKAGYACVVIDSLSHFWSGKGGIRDQVDARGGRFDAWRHATPIHDAMIKAILEYKGHVIVCLRSKVHYQVETNTAGGRQQTSVRKVGLAPVQREGLEFEFDLVATMENPGVPTMTVTKSRCSDLAGAVIREPGAAVAKTIRDWLGGATTTPAAFDSARPNHDAGERASEADTEAQLGIVQALENTTTLTELEAVAEAIRGERESVRLNTSVREAYRANRERLENP